MLLRKKYVNKYIIIVIKFLKLIFYKIYNKWELVCIKFDIDIFIGIDIEIV